MKLIFTLVTFFFGFQIKAFTPPKVTATPEKKSREEVNKNFRDALLEKIKRDRQVIEKMLGGGLFKQFDKQLEDMLKQFDDGFYKQFETDMNKFFEDKNFDKIFKNANPYQFMDLGDTKWIETPKERILIFKLDVSKETPLDIKIEKGKVKFKGQALKQTTWMENGKIIQGKKAIQFEREVMIPSDVRHDQAKFDKKEGNILIKFPKKYVFTPKKQDPKIQKLKPLKRRQGEPRI
jgi:HSP20 family molecular chaperone IbpA